MIKSPIKENKKLVLKNVLTKHYQRIDIHAIKATIDQFIYELRLRQIETTGPLVVRRKGGRIDKDGRHTTDLEVFIQAEAYPCNQDYFQTAESICFDRCLHLRYKGKRSRLHFAYSKLELYIFNHGLVTEDDTISVYVHEYQDHVEMDVFRPLKSVLT